MHLTFFRSIACQERGMCLACRDREGGRMFRQKMLEAHPETEAIADFECPFGVPWADPAELKRLRDEPRAVNPGGPSAVSNPVLKPDCKRASASLANMTSAAKVILRGLVEEPEVAARRLACSVCELACEDERGRFCGLCGCSTEQDGAPLRIFDLTLYKEGAAPAEKLCKYPRRDQGAGGWPTTRV